jgi:hypothetical protein
VTRHHALRLALAAGAAALGLAPTFASAAVVPSAAQEDFQLSGELAGLYPGIETTLDVAVTNPQPFAIEVVSVDVTALDAGPACPGALLEFGGIASTVDVPPGSTVSVPVSVRLDPAAPDACQGVTWSLRFTGTATAPDPAPAPGPPPPSAPDRGTGGTGAGSGGVATTGADVAGLTAIGVGLVVLGLWVRRRSGRRRLRGQGS